MENERLYFDEGDLVEAAKLIRGYCRKHICESCPFAMIFKLGTNEKRITCKLRRIPKDWELGGEENGR